jgi:hypothetical protein
MPSDSLESIRDFIGRRPLLSAFICMQTLFLIMYISIIYPGNHGALDSTISSINLVLNIFPASVPVIVISTILFGFINSSTVGYQTLSLLHRCKLATVTSFCILFPIIGWISIHRSAPNGIQVLLAPIISLISSVVLGIFFGSQARSSQGTIIVQSGFISLIMGGYCLCLFLLYRIRM